MNSIALTRIDDRLIHGQVMTSWLKFTGANKIMVVDDLVAADPFMKSVLKSCVPSSIMLAVYDEQQAAQRIMDGFGEQDKVIILAKYPKTLYNMMKQGVRFDTINIGGMGANAQRKKFYKNIAISDEERQIFREMLDAGVQLEIRIISQDSAVDVAKLL